MCRNIKRLRQPERMPTDDELRDAAVEEIVRVTRAATVALLLTGSIVQAAAGDAVFEVQVLDRGGAAVEGAAVEWLAGEDRTSTAAASATDNEGLAVLALEAGTYTVRVSAPGSLEFVSRPVACAADERCRVRAKVYPAAGLAGRVRAAEGNPLAEARACLSLHGREAYPADAVPEGLFDDEDEEGRACEVSAADGSVAFPPLPSGRYGLRIEAGGHVSHAAILELDGEILLDWKLSAGGSLAGRLIDFEDHGVTGAQVRLRHRERPDTAEATTDAEGRFRVPGLAPGRWNVALLPPDAAGMERDGVEIWAGRTADLGTLRTRPGSEIAGRVRGSGKPVAGAEVKLHEASPSLRFLRRTETGEDGRFRIGGLVADGSYLLVVLPKGGYAAGAVEDVEPPVRDLEIEVDAAAKVCGNVSLDGGELPSGLRVTTLSKLEGPLQMVDEASAASTEEIDRETGAFCLDASPSDEIDVGARASGYWADPVTTSAGPGEKTERVALRLRRGDTLEGTVVDPRGEPIADAAVFARGTAMAHTNRFGEFVLDGLRRGMNEIAARHADHAAVRVQLMVGPDTEPVTIEMRRGGTVEGAVSRADGEPAEAIAIRVENPEQQALTGADGRYRLEHVPSGVRTVVRRARGAYDDFERRNVEIVDGETQTVDFTLGVVLEGTVLRGGAGVPGVNLSLALPDGWHDGNTGSHAVQQTFSDETGAYRLAGARPGWGTFTLREGDQQVVRLHEIPAGETPRLDLVLPDVPIRGRVVSAADATGLAGAHVSSPLPTPDGAPESGGTSTYHSREGLGRGILYSITTASKTGTRADDDGNFVLRVDLSATQIEAWAPGYDSKTTPVDPGSPAPVTIELARRVNVELTVRDASGRLLPRTDVCFVRIRGDHSDRTCTGGNADPVRQSVDEGPTTILAGAPGFGTRVLEKDLRVPEGGGAVALAVQLVPGAGLRIRLVGQPDAGSKVVALVDPSGVERSLLVREARTGAGTGDRIWRTWPLEPGTWRVDLDPGDGHTLSKEIDITPGGDRELSFP